MSDENRPTIAVAGCGRWGKNLVRNFAKIGALGAVIDENNRIAEAMSAEHGVPARTWREMLDDPAITAVAIATPARSHARCALEALEAGKHIFVEKPLALKVDDALQVCDAAERAGRVLMVGHLLQYHAAFIRLRQMVADGELGRLQYIYSNRLNFGQIRREEDILWSFAPHDISMILSLAQQEPVSVSAVGAAYLHSTIADVTTTHLAFPDGLQAHVFVSWLHPHKEQRLIVIGDEGMAVFNDGEPWARKLLHYRHRVAWRDSLPVPEAQEGHPVALEPSEPLHMECEHFLDCCANGRRPRTDGAEGVRVLRVLDQASRSLRKESAVEKTSQPRESHEGVHPTAIVDDGTEIGEKTRIWHYSHILGGSKIGRSCVIGQNVMVGPDAIVGDNCKIQNNVSVYKGVTLEAGVFCGPSCVFTNVMNPRAEIERKNEFLPTLVRRGATIGANATIICGTTLGEHCFIGAGAVVTKNVRPFALVVGTPARQIGWVSHDGERLGKDLICPRSKRRYALHDDGNLIELT